MRLLNKILFTIFLLLFLANPAFATLWYVDNAAEGTDAGTSWTDAWPSFADVVWGGVGVVAGDTLYISGGAESKTYTEKWTIGASGSAGNLINIKPGSASASPDGHAGMVIFDYVAAQTGLAIGWSADYINFDGEKVGVSNITFKNFTNTSDADDCELFSGAGANGNIATYLTITDVGNAIVWGASSTNNEISYCTITGIKGDTAIRFYATGNDWDLNKIHHNTIEMMSMTGGGADGIQTGNGISIYNNSFSVTYTEDVFDGGHPDICQITGDNVKIYNNDFKNVGDATLDFDMWSNLTPENIYIYNNVFRIVDDIDTYPQYFRMYSSTSDITSLTNLKILNNTFIDNIGYSGSSYGISIQGVSATTASGVEIKNNIFYKTGDSTSGYTIIINESSGWTAGDFDIAQNVYYNPAEDMVFTIDGTAYSTATLWIASVDTTGIYGDVSFVSYALKSGDNDLHLAANDTTAMEAGADMSAYFTKDKD